MKSSALLLAITASLLLPSFAHGNNKILDSNRMSRSNMKGDIYKILTDSAAYNYPKDIPKRVMRRLCRPLQPKNIKDFRKKYPNYTPTHAAVRVHREIIRQEKVERIINAANFAVLGIMTNAVDNMTKALPMKSAISSHYWFKFGQLK